MTANTSRGGLLLGLLLFLTIGAIAASWWDLSRQLRSIETGAVQPTIDRLDAQADEIARLEAAIQALRIENKSERKGPAGVIEQIEHWAAVLGTLGRTDASYAEAEEAMDAALRAMSTHGDAAFGAIYDTLIGAPEDADMNEVVSVDERRKWLLKAAVRADAARGAELAARYLRARDAELRPSPRMRWLAADELIELDRVRAAAELRTILQTESARGIDPTQVKGSIPASRSMGGFHNFISRYVRAEDDEETLAGTLTEILGKGEHDMVTKQECIKILGEQKAEVAVPFIRRLFDEPTEIANNGIFKNHCVNALVAIQGSGACAWLLDKASDEIDQQVLSNLRTKITELGCER